MALKEYAFGKSKATVLSMVNFSTSIVAFVFYMAGYFTIKWARSDIENNKGHTDIGVWVVCDEWRGEEKWRYCSNLPTGKLTDISDEYVAFQIVSTINTAIMSLTAFTSVLYLSSARLNKCRRTVMYLIISCFLGVALTTTACILFLYCFNFWNEPISTNLSNSFINSDGNISKFAVNYSFIAVAISGVLELISCALMICELFLVDFKKQDLYEQFSPETPIRENCY